jgi:hypothetical protein
MTSPPAGPPKPVTPIYVHTESLRVGIRLTYLRLRGVIPTEDVVESLVRSGADKLMLREFPIEAVLQGVTERRRMYALKALEVLLLHTVRESGPMGEADLDHIVEKAWHVAAAMERQDGTAMQLSTIGKA